jgi:hypothetical protein
MSGISSVNSSSLYQLLKQQGVSGANSTGASPLKGDPSAKLDSALSGTNLSDEDRAALKTNLQSALRDVFSSGSFPPDPSKVEASVKSVFSKYGLDADALSAKLKPTGGEGFPLGGFGGAGQGGLDITQLLGGEKSEGSGSKTDSNEENDLLKAIKQFLDKLSSNNSSQSATDYLVTGLVGFDKSA